MRPAQAVSGEEGGRGPDPNTGNGVPWRIPERPTHTKQRLARLFSRDPNSTALVSNKRPDDWRRVLGPEDRRFLLQEFGDLLVKLGYEKSDDWVNAGR
ncbi:MAG: hypothetical protein ACLQUS_15125 [Desulfobaccales bacterium]